MGLNGFAQVDRCRNNVYEQRMEYVIISEVWIDFDSLVGGSVNPVISLNQTEPVQIYDFLVHIVTFFRLVSSVH